MSHGLLLAKVCWGGILTLPPHSFSLECEVTPQPLCLWHFMDWAATAWAEEGAMRSMGMEVLPAKK